MASLQPKAGLGDEQIVESMAPVALNIPFDFPKVALK
jgi:hypothetical protein